MKAPRGVLPTLAASFTADRRARVQEVLELVGLEQKANALAGLLAHDVASPREGAIGRCGRAGCAPML